MWGRGEKEEMMAKGEGKHTRLSHLNRSRNKSVRHEDMKLILLTICRKQQACNEKERRYTICKEHAWILRPGNMAYYSVLLFFLVMAQNWNRNATCFIYHIIRHMLVTSFHSKEDLVRVLRPVDWGVLFWRIYQNKQWSGFIHADSDIVLVSEGCFPSLEQSAQRRLLLLCYWLTCPHFWLGLLHFVMVLSQCLIYHTLGRNSMEG